MKILVVFTGGTIACGTQNGILSTESGNVYLLIERYKREIGGVEFETTRPYTILSENLSYKNLNLLCECLKSVNSSDYDGIIVTHGTDTLQYTASFLGYAFSSSEIPIVIVSAGYPLGDSRSNGFDNFCAAIDFISSNIGRGVFVSYKNENECPKIHRASRLLPHLPFSDYTASVENCFFAEIRDGKLKQNKNFSEKEDEFKFENIRLTGGDVLKITPYVDMIYPEITRGIKAVLFESYHSGTLGTSDSRLCEFCGNAEDMNIPIFVIGSDKGFEYESKLGFKRLGLRILPVISPISAYIKLRMLSKENIDNMFKSCGGDIKP